MFKIFKVIRIRLSSNLRGKPFKRLFKYYIILCISLLILLNYIVLDNNISYYTNSHPFHTCTEMIFFFLKIHLPITLL